MIASLQAMVHTRAVAQTKATWFGDQTSRRRTTATWRYFFVHLPLRALYGRAIAGRGSPLPVSVVAGSPTLLSARPPHLAMTGGPSNHTEADMAKPSHISASHSPLIESAAVLAAELWLVHTPASLAVWRDQRFATLAGWLTCADTPAYKAAFDQAYALRIGQAMVGVTHE